MPRAFTLRRARADGKLANALSVLLEEFILKKAASRNDQRTSFDTNKMAVDEGRPAIICVSSEEEEEDIEKGTKDCWTLTSLELLFFTARVFRDITVDIS